MRRKPPAKTAGVRSGGASGSGARECPVPGKEVGASALPVIGDAGENVGRPCARIDAIGLAGLDERKHRCAAIAPAVAAAEGPIV